MKFYKRKRDEAPPTHAEAASGSVTEDSSAAPVTGPVAFGYKRAWLAIRTEDTKAAAEALGVCS